MNRTNAVGATLLIATATALWWAGNQLLAHPQRVWRSTSIAAVDELSAIQRLYGQDDTAFVVVRARPVPEGSGTLFSVSALRELKTFTQALAHKEVCRAVIDVMDVMEINEEDDEPETTPLVAEVPGTQEQAAALRRKVLADANVADQLVASDGRAALVLCPLAQPEAWSGVARFVQNYSSQAFALRLAGPLGIALGLGEDLRTAGLRLLTFALFYLGALLYLETHAARWLSLRRRVDLGMIVLVGFALLLGWQAARLAASPFETLLGTTATRAHEALDTVSNMSRSLLIDVATDLEQVDNLARLERFCDAIEPLGRLRCPARVLRRISVMLGESGLPQTPDQLKAMWLFAGDHPELATMFTADHGHALVRLSFESGAWGPRSQDVAPAIGQIAHAAKASGVSARVAGFLLIDHALRPLSERVLAGILLGAIVAYVAGRRLRLRATAHAGVWLLGSLIVPVSLVSLVLLTVGAWTLFASLGSRRSIHYS